MRPAFHEDATIFGYAGADLFAGPIQRLFDWVDETDPATELQARIARTVPGVHGLKGELIALEEHRRL